MRNTTETHNPLYDLLLKPTSPYMYINNGMAYPKIPRPLPGRTDNLSSHAPMGSRYLGNLKRDENGKASVKLTECDIESNMNRVKLSFQNDKDSLSEVIEINTAGHWSVYVAQYVRPEVTKPVNYLVFVPESSEYRGENKQGFVSDSSPHSSITLNVS
jgi:hypothetical protein